MLAVALLLFHSCKSALRCSSGCYTDGLVHISKMAQGRVDNVHDYVEVDQELDVWVGRSSRWPVACLVVMSDVMLGDEHRPRKQQARPYDGCNLI